MLMVRLVVLVVVRYVPDPCRVTGTPFLLNGIPVHSGVQALSKPAASTLIASCFVDRTSVFVGFAPILSIASD